MLSTSLQSRSTSAMYALASAASQRARAIPVRFWNHAYYLAGEGQGQYLFDGLDVVDSDLFQQFRLNVLDNVLFVLGWNDDFEDLGAPCRQYLFFNTTYRQDVTAERDLS